ncbi:MAG: hypothetical protein KA902_01535 [Arenimonas sp.]|nr:hypothetical protein [Arenimonas sp.]
MMTTASVSLDVRNFAATPGDGYTDTTATNNAVYSYKYSGGTDGNGGVEVITGTGTLILTVTISADPRYLVSNVTFDNNLGDLSWAFGESAYVAVITDTDLDNENSYYSVIVSDHTAGCTMPCDPPITNKPRPPASA